MPSWLPGARFKRYAREWYPIVVRSINAPFDKVKKELVSNGDLPSPRLPRRYIYLGRRNGNSLRRRKHHIET
jgi:hypothetical protein